MDRDEFSHVPGLQDATRENNIRCVFQYKILTAKIKNFKLIKARLLILRKN